MILKVAEFLQWKVEDLRKRLPAPEGFPQRCIWAASMLFEFAMLFPLLAILWAGISIWDAIGGNDDTGGFA